MPFVLSSFSLWGLFVILSYLFCPRTFSLKKASIGFENMFEEVPIVIKNSHLINVLMWDLEDKSTVSDKHELLNLSSRSDLASSSTHAFFLVLFHDELRQSHPTTTNILWKKRVALYVKLTFQLKRSLQMKFVLIFLCNFYKYRICCKTTMTN